MEETHHFIWLPMKALDIFKYIVEHVTDKNPSNDCGETPFQYALENDHYNVVDYIFKHGNQGCQGL